MRPSASPPGRLIARVPPVHVGPAAEPALRGEPGVLLGTRRPYWIDVLHLDPRSRLSLRELVGLRFEAFEPWEVVGMSFGATEIEGSLDGLLADFVPGDVILTERGALVHLGDGWRSARVERF